MGSYIWGVICCGVVAVCSRGFCVCSSLLLFVPSENSSATICHFAQLSRTVVGAAGVPALHRAGKRAHARVLPLVLVFGIMVAGLLALEPASRDVVSARAAGMGVAHNRLAHAVARPATPEIDAKCLSWL